jgi:hypothetical protein
MDNISVLRQLMRDATTDPVVLFDPADVTRSVSRGVIVDYYLKQPADKVTIEFLDAQGHTIRTFSGAPEAQGSAKPGAAPAAADEEGGGGPAAAAARVTTRDGMNRFTWDMRYPDARGFPGMILWAGSLRGPQVPPGRYQVRLTAGSVTKTQDFEIRRNAAVRGVTDADLAEQFTLAKAINDKVTLANETVVRIRGLKEEIAGRVGKTSDAKIKNAGQALIATLTDIEGEIYQHRNRSSQDPLNYPIRLNNKLAALQGVVESGDHKPTDQSYAVFKELAGRLDKQLARFDMLTKTELEAFSRMATGGKPRK